MARILTVKETLALGDKDIPEAVKGRIKSVGAFFASEPPGQWSIQDIVLVDLDEPGLDILCKFSNRPDLGKDWAGKVIHLLCASGDKGLTGLKVRVENKGKQAGQKFLSVLAQAEVVESVNVMVATTPENRDSEPVPEESLAGEVEVPGAAGRTITLPPAPARAPGAMAPETISKLDTVSRQAADVREVTHESIRFKNLQKIAWRRTLELAQELADECGLTMTPDMLQACAASQTIHLDHQGCAEKMPTTTLRSPAQNGGDK